MQKHLDRMLVTTAQVQLVWDTRSMAQGLYSVELMNNGERLQTERLVVNP